MEDKRYLTKVLGHCQVFPRLRARSLIKVHYAEAWCTKGLSKKKGGMEIMNLFLESILISWLWRWYVRVFQMVDTLREAYWMMNDVVHLLMLTTKFWWQRLTTSSPLSWYSKPLSCYWRIEGYPYRTEHSLFCSVHMFLICLEFSLSLRCTSACLRSHARSRYWTSLISFVCLIRMH